MITVRDILRQKGNKVWTVSAIATVYRALELMAEQNVGAVCVVGPGDKIVGIFSERDYARKVILMGKSSRDTLVNELMTHPVVTVSPTDDIDRCMALMTDRHIRHLPVVDDDELIGLVSIGDVVRAVISEQQTHINDLQNFITGRRA